MHRFRLLLMVALAVWGIQHWHQHHSLDASASVLPSADSNGFVHMPPVEGQQPDTVYVFAGRHCSQAAARRALQLAQDLNDEGIPVVRTISVRFVPVGLVVLNDSGVHRVNAILSARSPIVFVHGKAKGAATLEEVEAEFRTSAR